MLWTKMVGRRRALANPSHYRARSLGCRYVLTVALLTAACGEASSHRLGGAFAQGGITDENVGKTLRIGLCGAGADLELIDDMEDENQAISRTGGRSGSWFSFNDLSTNGEQYPLMSAQIFPMEQLEPPRGTSTFAVHTSGSGFTGWGAGIGFELSSTLAYDASGYGGIAFWARIAEGSSTDWRVNVTDRNTSQFGLVCDLDCQPDVGPQRTASERTDGICRADAGACHDYFGADLDTLLSPEWKLFTYSWSQLTTKNWSGKDLTAIATTSLFGFRLQANGPPSGRAPRPFEIWLDDVAFLCR